jgi:hypothetical protein
MNGIVCGDWPLWIGQRPFNAVQTATPFHIAKEPVMDHFVSIRSHREPWNKGKLVGQKAPLKLKDIWAIRVRLQISDRARDLASHYSI